MRALPWVVAVLVMVAAVEARGDGFDGQRFVPAAGAAGGLVVERPLVPQRLGFGFGVGVPIDPVWRGAADVFDGQRLAAGPGIGDIRLVPKMAWYFGRSALN